MDWTDEHVETLKQLWKQGLSSRQIADHFGETTRNAVIGKAHRLGLPSRTTPARKPSRPLLALGERACQWPIGHPGAKDFNFCGAVAGAGKPYCSEHCMIAYRRGGSESAS